MKNTKSIQSVTNAPTVVSQYLATKLKQQNAYIVNADGTVTMASEAQYLTKFAK